MTNINCSKNCIYQRDGKCCYDSVMPQAMCAIPTDADCVYRLTAKQAEELGNYSPAHS